MSDAEDKMLFERKSDTASLEMFLRTPGPGLAEPAAGGCGPLRPQNKRHPGRCAPALEVLGKSERKPRREGNQSQSGILATDNKFYPSQ